MEINFFPFLVVLVLIWIAVVLSVRRAIKGKVPKVREMAALEAIEESIGSAVERGRPVHYTPGFPSHEGGLISGASGALIAGLSCLSYIAEKTAELGAELITTFCNPEVVPVAEEIIKTAYTKAGVPENYKMEMVRFISRNQFGYAIGVIGLLEREKVGTNILIGPFMAEALIIAEAGNAAGAIQIAGEPSVGNLAFLIVACDYCLIGEEMYAASAYLSKDVIKLGALSAQDLGKISIIALFILGAILQFVGIKWLYNVLNI